MQEKRTEKLACSRLSRESTRNSLAVRNELAVRVIVRIACAKVCEVSWRLESLVNESYDSGSVPSGLSHVAVIQGTAHCPMTRVLSAGQSWIAKAWNEVWAVSLALESVVRMGDQS